MPCQWNRAVLHPSPFLVKCQTQESAKLNIFSESFFFLLFSGSHDDHTFDWGSRLSVAASIADSLAYMHKGLHQYEIAHGNLKSTNILFDRNKHMRISEYGLMVVDNQKESFLPLTKGFKNNGFDLPTWVHSVIREEWTVEVFDGALQLEGASEERMVNLLQIALKCVNLSPNERPSMAQVAAMIIKIKEEEEEEEVEGSISFDAGSSIFL